MADRSLSYLSAADVSLIYGVDDNRTVALNSISLELPPTGFIGLMGPSGSGKSSLLYLLSGLKLPTSGTITMRSETGEFQLSKATEIARTELRKQQFGFVFQQPFMLNYLTVEENIAVGANSAKSTVTEACNELMSSLDIAHLAKKYPYQLSGGERQRVCVARAMINSPRAIFADEPTAALDHKNGHNVVDLLSSYRNKGLVVIVTHDPEMVSNADVVHRMRDGRLED